MGKMTKLHINKCHSCQLSKQIRHTKERQTITDTPTTTFETISIDTIGPLRYSDNFRYILLLQDELSKYIIVQPITTKDAKTIAKTIVEKVILKYGHFKTLKSDNGTEFKNEIIKNICDMLNISQRFTANYHHQSLGANERNHRVLNEFLLNLASENNWHYYIPFYEFSYNITPHVNSTYSPYEIIFGKLPYLPDDVINCKNPVYDLHNYASEVKARIKHAIERAKQLIELEKTNRDNLNLEPINSITLSVGDLVLIHSESRRKQERPYKGPFKITKIINNNVTLEINGKEKTYHKNSLKLYNSN